jgi:UDP-N-acetylglucosamine--N-acetylmuramyl-(pentapeptide) pyrophosphoryl-undecaprenol N-acetylglucosamine transferase
VISRSGAITVSELHATATPSILVPLPAGKGYQALNAEDFAKVGGGVVIAQDRRDEIIHTAQILLGDEVKRKQMSDTAAASRHHGVAREVAQHLIEVAVD